MLILSEKQRTVISAVVEVAYRKPNFVQQGHLADMLDVSPRYLEGSLQSLCQHDILNGRRGPAGGYSLARDAVHISVGDILRATSSGDVEMRQSTRKIERDLTARVDSIMVWDLMSEQP